MDTQPRDCFRDPIPEIFDAARFLDAAVSAHRSRNLKLAKELIIAADMAPIRDWTESIWGGKSAYVKISLKNTNIPILPMDQRVKIRMPNGEEKKNIYERDGYHCRFCGIPIIRKEVRERIRAAYPDALPWGTTNQSQHAAFQAMWAQYDHVLPHARGGDNSVNNIVLTCAPCNFGRMNYTVDEVGLYDPRNREPIRNGWDGLERFL